MFFLKSQFTSKLSEDLMMLYAKLVELGIEYREGKVYVADIEEVLVTKIYDG